MSRRCWFWAGPSTSSLELIVLPTDVSPTPSVGRVVHYVSHGTPVQPCGAQAFPPACRAATVTEVDPDDPARVGLAVTNPTGSFFNPLSGGGSLHQDVSGGLVGGSWHWPERG